MKSVIQRRIILPRYRKETEKTATSETYRKVRDGDDHLMIDIEIDFDEVATIMGSKAWSNKSNKAVEAGGLLIVRAREAK
jgi:hypothetical protein